MIEFVMKLVDNVLSHIDGKETAVNERGIKCDGWLSERGSLSATASALVDSFDRRSCGEIGDMGWENIISWDGVALFVQVIVAENGRSGVKRFAKNVT